MRLLGGAFAALYLAACPLGAQQPADAPADNNGGEFLPGAPRTGARLYNFSFFGDYYSNGLPANFSTGGGNLQSDVAYGGSIGMGWIRTGPRLNVTVQYTPTYTGRMRYSSLHSFGHDLSANFNLVLSPKWTVVFNAAGMIRDLQRSMFAPTAVGQLASAPATFNGLASSLVSGQNTNLQVGAVLNAPPVATSPTTAILYGNQYLTAGLSTNVTYTRSERFHISFGVNATRSQSLSQTTSAALGTPIPVLPRSTYGNVTVSAFYGLTQRLTLSGGWDGQQSLSSRQGASLVGKSFIQNTSANLGYMAGMRWLFTVGGGVGILPSALRTTAGVSTHTPSGLRYLANGSVAYKFYSQTLIVRVNRTTSNAYGLGATTTLLGDLGWTWARPGSLWAATATAGYQSFGSQAGFSSGLGGWRGTAALNRLLTRNLTVGADYSFLRNTGVFNAVSYSLNRSAVQVILTWSFAPQMGPTP